MTNSTPRRQRAGFSLFCLCLLVAGSVWGQTCPTPTNGRTDAISTNSAQVSWSGSSPYLGFNVRYRPLNSSNWITASTTNTYSANLTLSGLTNAVTYEWQVQQVCEDLSTSAFTGSTTFTTGCSLPNSIYAYGIGPTSFQPSWSGQSGVSYTLLWRQQGTTTWNTTPNMGQSGRVLSGLTPSTPYEWQVQTDCGGGNTSGLSAVQSLTTLACDTPVGLGNYTPNANATQVYWSGPGGNGTVYDLQYRQQGSTTWSSSFTTTNNSFAIPGLTPTTAYQFQVRSVCGLAGSSVFSSPFSFTTSACPASVSVPTSVYSTNVRTSSANLYWYNGNTGTNTDIQYRPQGSGSWIALAAGNDSPYSLTGLTSGTAYEWQVRAACSGGVVSAWTASQSFTTTACSAPTSPGNLTPGPTTAYVYWGGSSNNVYRIEYRPAASANWQTISPINSSNFSFTGLTPSTAYVWQVQTVCSPTTNSPFSNSATFTTSACVVPSSSGINFVLPTSAQVYWYGPTGASYELQWRAGTSGAWTTVSSLTSTIYTLTGLTNNTVYQFQVQSVCSSSASSTYSTPFSFTTNCQAPSSPYRSTSQATSQAIGWYTNYSNAVVSYGVQFRPKAPANSLWTSLPTPTDTYATINGLTPGTAYEFQVQTVCPGGVSSSFTSPPTGFTTTGCTTNSARNFSTSNVTYRSARIRWFGNASDHFMLLYRPTGTTTWSSVGPVPANYASNGFILNNLNPSTAYQWQVTTYCSPTQSTTGAAIQSFTTTGCVNPVQANGMYANATFSSANLSWSSGNTGDVFRVQYRPVGGSFTVLPDQTSSGYSLTGLATNVTYEWQVALVCSASLVSPVASNTFATTCPIRTTNLNRTNTFSSANLSWSNYNFGDVHDVYYRVQGGQWTVVQSVSASYSGSYSLTGLAPNTVYEWGLAYKCSPTASSTILMGPSFTTTCANTFQASMLNTYNVTPTTAQLSYYNFNNAGGAYDVRYRVQGSPTWITSTSVTFSSLSLTSLTPNTIYEWQAAVRCSATVSSAFTNSQTFVTECRVPTNPYTNNITFNGALLGWYGSTGVTYEVDYQQQGASNWTTVTTTSTSYNLTTVSGAITWRVRSNCGGGTVSGYTTPLSFTTVCNTPSYVSTEVSSYAARLQWPNIGTGARYNLQWRQGNGGWNTIPNITRSEYVMTGLTNGAAYQVQVQGVCGAQTSASFSPQTSFTATCPVPSFLTVSPLTAPNSRYFSWGTTFGVSYVLQWRVQGSSTWNTSPVLNKTNSNANYTLNNLAPGAYDCQVGAICADGVTTSYRPGSSFTVVAGSCNTAPPTANSPVVGFTVAGLHWSGNGAGNTAEVRWRPQGSPDWNVATNLVGGLALRGLQGNTTYEWQVRTLCPVSQTTVFGTLQTFTTRCRELAVSLQCVDPTRAQVFNSVPLDPISGISSLLSFLGIGSNELAVSAELNWREAGNANAPWATSNTISVGTSYTITGLTNNTVYEYRVRNVCSPTVSSTYTVPASFTTQCRQPTSLYGNSYNCSAASIGWNGCYDFGTTYQIQYRAVGSGNWTSVSTTNPYYTLSNLVASTLYEFQVRADCSSGIQTSFSGSFTFTTPSCSGGSSCASPYSLNAYDITSSAGSLQWYASSTPVELRWRQGATGAWTTVPNQYQFYQLSGLANNTAYDWQVRANCADPDDFTPTSFFRTVCNIPFSPGSSNVRAESALVNWNSFNNGTTYEIRYRVGTGAWVSVTTGVNAASQLLTGLTNNTTYEWQIRTLCTGGSTSDWSHSLFFTTTCPAPANLFTDRIDATTVRCTWTRPYTGVNSTLQYRQPGTGVWTTVGGLTSSGTSVTYTVTGLSEQTTYEWQVTTDCGSGISSGTPNQPITFRTTGTAPPCASMITVQNGDWTNPAVWSCNRVPLATDPVQIRHNVMIPDNGTGRASRLSYDAGGQVRFGTQARLLLGL